MSNGGVRNVGRNSTQIAGGARLSMDPIHQFQIKNLFPVAQIGPFNIAFTNSALFMVLSVAAITVFLLGATRGRALVPGRLQMAAEVFYTFMADALRNAAGPEGMVFFPLVFSLFMFVLFANVLGLIPVIGFTVTSHIIITVALALLVFFTVIVVGFWKNGLHFFRNGCSPTCSPATSRWRCLPASSPCWARSASSAGWRRLCRSP